jgi:hypothetical protein
MPQFAILGVEGPQTTTKKPKKRPQTIIGKKLPRIHSKMVVRINKTGPVKKKIPLHFSSGDAGIGTRQQSKRWLRPIP